MLTVNYSGFGTTLSPSQQAAQPRYTCAERNTKGRCMRWVQRASGFGWGFGAALTEDEIIKLAQEVSEKANANGAAVLEVTNIFRLIDDQASQDAVALRAAGLVAAVAGKATSIQASLAEARLLGAPPPLVSPTEPAPATPTTTVAGLSRGAKIGIGVAAAGLLAVGLTLGISAARRR
jgi:hypothetical protein